MNQYRFITATALAALTLTACQPSDQKVKSVRERLEAGETVEFTKPGMKTPNCGNAVWSTIKLSGKQERDRVILGSQYSIVNAGYKFCGRIGLPVDMEIFKETGFGRVIVTKISLVKLDRLRPTQLKGKFFANAGDFDQFKSNIKLYPDNQGIITIIDTSYAEGSAKDEKAVRDRDGESRNVDGFQETTQDGQDISGCPTAWNDLGVNENFQSAVLNGEIGSWYSLGDKNCIRQGSIVNIKARAAKEEPVKGTLKVIKIKRLRMNFLDARYFDMRGFDFEKLKTQIAKEDTRRNEWITVVDFEKKQTEIRQISVNKADIQGDEAVATVQGQVDFKSGEMVNVNILNPDSSITAASATVLNSMKTKDTTLVRIKFVTGGLK